MKRVLYQTKMYDYTSENEALKHKTEMENKGWKIKQDLYNNGGDCYCYTIEYYKES